MARQIKNTEFKTILLNCGSYRSTWIESGSVPYHDHDQIMQSYIYAKFQKCFWARMNFAYVCKLQPTVYANRRPDYIKQQWTKNTIADIGGSNSNQQSNIDRSPKHTHVRVRIEPGTDTDFACRIFCLCLQLLFADSLRLFVSNVVLLREPQTNKDQAGKLRKAQKRETMWHL